MRVPRILFLAFLVASCAERTPPPAPDPAAVEAPEPSPLSGLAVDDAPRLGAAPVLIRGVPHVRQKPDFCGEACAEMVLGWLGRKGTQDDVFDLSGIDPALGRGAVTPELKRGLERLGFRVGDVWYRIDAARGAAELTRHFAELYA